MVFIPIIIWLLFEVYVFKGVSSATSFIESTWLRKTILIGYWVFPMILAILMLQTYIDSKQLGTLRTSSAFSNLMGAIVLLIVPKLIIFSIHIIEDVAYLFQLIYTKLFVKEVAESSGNGISRLRFITQVGVVLAVLPFISILYGILFGRFNFTVVNKKLSFKNLPKAFDGLKVVHISDMHLGSFLNNYAPVEKAIEMINDLNPDLILFTGDLVNNSADEVDGWEPVLSKLNAKLGKFSITGNHDYGDYLKWETKELKQQNFELFKEKHKAIGFELLLNKNIRFTDDEENAIVIAGIENWGKPPFKQYGNLSKTLENVSDEEFTILMSHDPSHWDEEVIKQSKADLTLSGHTHGMQFGIDIPGLKWSPVKYKYPRWSGLYQEGNQYLYVNRGFGYLAFPGRVGMPPEITMIELNKA